jgi:DNA (cytosine-5)-methyltransferase 1
MAIVPFDTTQITSPQNGSKPKPGDPCHPIMAKGHAPAVAFQERGRDGGRSLEINGDLAYAMTAPNGGGRAQERNILAPDMSVRRLTPTECERLQGFPDGYTLIPYRGKPAADGPRYKALGNSMAVPVMRWIGERIQMVEDLPC